MSLLREQGRSAGNQRSSSPSNQIPLNQIPLNVLRQPFVQNSSAESSNLSSSHSASTTPPSSAERLPPQETWPSLADGNPDLPAATPPQLLQPPPTIEACAEAAASNSDAHSIPPADHGNQEASALQEHHSGSTADPQGSSFVGLGRWVSKRSWFQSILGISSLLVAMVSLFVYGLRSYEMAKWSLYNDLLQTCAGLIQANITRGPECERYLKEGPTSPPYSKRAMMYTPGVGAYKLMKRTTAFMQHVYHVDWTAHTAADYGFGGMGNLALAALSALAMAGGVLALLRSRSPEEVVFTSAARSEGSVKVTRHYPEGPETIESEGPIQITRRYPPEDQSPGEIRRRITQDCYREEEEIQENEGRLPWNSRPSNCSEDTMVAVWTEPISRNVSIATGSDEGFHEGLIELKPTKNTKNFLDPDTGLSYHLSPWKSTHDSDEDDKLSLKSKSKPEGTVKQAIIGMSVGGAALANGKAIEDKIAQALEKKERVPQQAGDCLAGEVTLEPPTGKPTLA